MHRLFREQIIISSLILGVLILPIPLAFAQVQYSTYTDPQGRFSLEYPSNWNVKVDPENRFNINAQVVFINPDSALNGHINFILSRDKSPLSLDSNFDAFLNEIPSASSVLHAFTVIGDRNTTTYTIAGNKASSQLFSAKASANDLPTGGMVVMAMTDDERTVTILYISLQDHFDENLPVIEHMINSVKILK